MKRQLVLLSMLLGCAGVAAGQETTGGIRGRLRSAAAGAVASAEISATSPDLQGTRRTFSAGDGVFLFLALPPGTYTLRVAAIGYRALVIQAVQVQLGRTTGLGDLPLEPATVELEAITVTAPRVTLDPVHTSIGATLEAADYAALPGERDYTSLIAILPHINTSYNGDPVNSGGSTGLENMYFIDGVNVTSPLDAATGTSLPYNFVRSVEVRAGGYEAQYGRALGAIVNAVTYTGTNDFETNTFAFFTHSALAAEPRAQPTLREVGAYGYDIGARISGPLMRDRLWFSAAYNPRIEHVDREIAGLGTFPDRRTAQIFSGKLTWQVRPAATLELSLFGDPTTHHRVRDYPLVAGFTPLSPGPFLERLETGGHALSLRGTATIGRALLVEASLARSTGRNVRRAESDAARTQAIFTDYVERTIDGGMFAPTEVRHARAAGTLRATITTGPHTVVVGAEYEESRATLTVTSPGGGIIQRVDTALYTVDSQTTNGTVHSRVPTTYLQDSWRVTDRLTFNIGVRWSGQFLVGASGGGAQRFPDEWQPRLGFSWQPGRSGSQRLLGSYARVYQQQPLSLASLWYVDYYYTKSFYSVDPRQQGVVADSVWNLTTLEADWARSIPGLRVENFDEYTLGYERLLGSAARLTLRGVRRALRSAFLFGVDPSNPRFWVLGTPGKGDFAFLPPPRREYTALEATVGGAWRRFQYQASYVLSRTRGNYNGLFDSDAYGLLGVGQQEGFLMPHQAVNSTGLLPNDRTHVLKLMTSWRTASSLTIGTFFTWQSGTPITEFGAWAGGPFPPAFVSPRGSAGRTPPIWDLSVRLAYQAGLAHGSTTRFVLDLLHVGNPRTSVRVDQRHYSALDAQGSQANPNPNYLQPIAFQPPMAARLGVEVAF